MKHPNPCRRGQREEEKTAAAARASGAMGNLEDMQKRPSGNSATPPEASIETSRKNPASGRVTSMGAGRVMHAHGRAPRTMDAEAGANSGQPPNDPLIGCGLSLSAEIGHSRDVKYQSAQRGPSGGG